MPSPPSGAFGSLRSGRPIDTPAAIIASVSALFSGGIVMRSGPQSPRVASLPSSWHSIARYAAPMCCHDQSALVCSAISSKSAGWPRTYIRPLTDVEPPSTLPRVHGSDLPPVLRSEEHTSELQSLLRLSYAVFCV